YSGGTTWFFATNHLGTIAARMNVKLMETYRYLPYGERYAGTQTPHQYTGKERDNESNLDYFGARYYASAHGRWMSVDPEIHYPFDPQSLNRYSYVRSDPIGKIDVSGRWWETGNCVDVVVVEGGFVVGIKAVYCAETLYGELSRVASAALRAVGGAGGGPPIAQTRIARDKAVNLLESLVSKKPKCADALGLRPGQTRSLLDAMGITVYDGPRPKKENGQWKITFAFTNTTIDRIYINANSGFSRPDGFMLGTGSTTTVVPLDIFNQENQDAIHDIGKTELSVQEFWATIIGHEMGHITGALESNDMGDEEKTKRNNRKVIENCIGE
ncbi:MAG: RHS repeat-associated core domain-containing protein, partial [Acidobacteriota bacterium]